MFSELNRLYCKAKEGHRSFLVTNVERIVVFTTEEELKV